MMEAGNAHAEFVGDVIHSERLVKVFTQEVNRFGDAVCVCSRRQQMAEPRALPASTTAEAADSKGWLKMYEDFEFGLRPRGLRGFFGADLVFLAAMSTEETTTR